MTSVLDNGLVNGVQPGQSDVVGPREPPSESTNNADLVRPALPPNRKMQLCGICAELGLEPDRFFVERSSQKPCKSVVLSQLPSRTVANFSAKSNCHKILLGDFDAIAQRSKSCPFCKLVIRSVGGDFDHSLALSENPHCYMHWEIDGRKVEQNSMQRPLTRRIHVTWTAAWLTDAYIVYFVPLLYFTPKADAHDNYQKEALFLGRSIAPNSDKQALLISWLDLCRDHHTGLCRAAKELDSENAKRFEELFQSSYFGVIDVLSMHLCPLPYDGTRQLEPRYAPYVALSHVWGQKRPNETEQTGFHVTKQCNVRQCRLKGGLGEYIDKCPKVIRDTIELVKRLGLRYLWVDSLCIVQDSTQSWNLNACKMDLIYGGAQMTVCAADGHDSSTGLLAMHAQDSAEFQMIEEIRTGFSLMVNKPVEASIRRSTWNQRAWTFQERVLSKRCLIFTEGRVYFQCRSTGMSEDIYADQEGAGWSLDLVNAPLKSFRALEVSAITFYLDCIPLYTSRKLTEQSDILAAFSGISNLMESHLKAPLIFGLPSSHLDLALLWEPQGLARSRLAPLPGSRSARRYVNFPSWSWCGWQGSAIHYQQDMIKDCLIDVHEWLTRRTWILWHIRDGHGRLRPLWRGIQTQQDDRTDKRWRGYVPPQHDRREQFEPSQTSMSASHDAGDNLVDVETHEFTRRRIECAAFVEHEQCYYVDDYGRRVDKEYSTRPPVQNDQHTRPFMSTLPDHPYQVVMDDSGSRADIEFPDQHILQFWTWRTHLYILPGEPSIKETANMPQRYNIADDAGDWCGSLVIHAERFKIDEVQKCEFIAVSEAKSFTNEECPVWTYYVPRERDQSEWDLYYVLLVERKDDVYRRIAIGKVFRGAFRDGSWVEIVLG